MESVNKLREWSRWLDSTYATDDGKSYTVYSYQPYDGMKSCGEHMREQCDEIEREIAERYMELPVDSDGVPIRVGDHMEMEYATTEVVGIGPDYYITGERIEECLLLRNGWNFAHGSRHVKPRTLEDVLRDAMQFGHDDNTVGERADEVIAKYAAEIRELLEVR